MFFFYICFVKSFVLHLVTLLIFASSVSMNQLSNLSTFVHHFNEHQELDQDLTISDFIYNHYVSVNHPDDQHSDHEKLPFKSTNFHVVNFVLLDVHMVMPELKHTFPNKRKKILARSDSFNLLVVRAIWHPPLTA